MKQVLCAAALAAGAAAALADEYGCTVWMCLSNPASNGGPRRYEECRPSIDRFVREMRRGKPFPKCERRDGNDPESFFVRIGSDPYELCPDPLAPAPAGSYVVQGTLAPIDSKTGWYVGGQQFILAGEPQASEPSADLTGVLGQRACIGTVLGVYTAGGYDGGNYTVSVVDQVTWLLPQTMLSIDVYIGGQIYNRTHW